jgi:hypothetical protein
MSGNILRRRPAILFAMLVSALLFTSGLPSMSDAQNFSPQPPQVVPESTVGYSVDGPRLVISIKPGEKLVLHSSPKNLGINLKGKTVVVKDANFNVVPFDTIALNDKVTVWRKDDKVYIQIAPKPTTEPVPH